MPKTKRELPTIAVDFDGVLHDHKNSVEGRRMGPPIEGAKEALIELMQRGYRVVIFSVWAKDAGVRTIVDWCDYYGIPFDDVKNVKPAAVCYIDDKAVRFTGNWPATLKAVDSLLDEA